MTKLRRLTQIGQVFDPSRMIADGIAIADVEALRGQAPSFEEWLAFWTGRADEYERLGRRSQAEGALLTAGSALWQASISCHYAQLMWYHDTERRQATQDRKARLYDAAAPMLSPSALRVNVPFEGHDVPGFLRVPRGDPPAQGWPWVVLIGGTESTKEESRLFEELCLARGIATYAFDGPGQGELWQHVKVQPNFERWTSAVVDVLQKRPELDPGRVAVLGRSLGGHYAIRAAAADERFCAAAAWGIFWDYSYVDDTPLSEELGNLYIAGYYDGERDDAEAGNAYLREVWDLSDVAGNLRAPTYVLHGTRDPIFTQDQLRRCQEGLAHVPVEWDIRDAGHCCHDIPHLVRPRMADWLAVQLEAPPA